MVEFRGADVQYLGDGVYASVEGDTVWLQTSDGVEILQEVALEPEVLHELAAYQLRQMKRLRRSVAEPQPPSPSDEDLPAA